MVLQFHPTILSDLTPEQAFESNNGIIHVFSSDVPNITTQFWITTSSILSTFTQDWQGAGYNVLYFTPFSTKGVWTRLYPDQPITNMIFARLTATDPLPIPLSSSPMSTSPTPETSPSHNSPSNAPVNPTAALIALMHQTLQQNATLMAHLQTSPSPPSFQQTSISPK